MTIVNRFVFKEHGKFYPQVYLDEYLPWVINARVQ